MRPQCLDDSLIEIGQRIVHARGDQPGAALSKVDTRLACFVHVVQGCTTRRRRAGLVFLSDKLLLMPRGAADCGGGEPNLSSFAPFPPKQKIWSQPLNAPFRP